MARKEIDVTIATEGRDHSKVFHIREMSAMQAEKWALRALLALAHAGVDLGPNVMGAGMAGIAAAGIQALAQLQFEDAEPLLDELFTCIKIKPSPQVIRELTEDDIEEVATRLQLRWEVLKLHVNFSTPADQSTLDPATPNSTMTSKESRNTSTSPPPSGQRFHPAKRQRESAALS